MQRKCRFLTCLAIIFSILLVQARAQNELEGRAIVEPIEIVFEEKGNDKTERDLFYSIIRDSVGDRYSLVKVRSSLQALYDTGRIVWAKVEAQKVGNNGVSLKYTIKRKLRIREIKITIGETVGEKISEEEILLRANFLSVGSAINEQALRRNADSIQSYLRERGFYNASVRWKLNVDSEQETKADVEFEVTPSEQARVERFDINVRGFDAEAIRRKLKLNSGEFFSNRKLDEDFAKIKEEILQSGYLAPYLEEPKVVFDPDKNTISIEVTGNVGPKVEVKVEAGDESVGERTQKRLLPIRREGTLEQSAIVEGARRLRNYFQEKGYFFAQVRPVCAVTPPLSDDEVTLGKNYTEFLCGFLSGANLENRSVEVIYKVNLNRRLNLREIRIEGTDKIKVEDVLPILETQPASIIGLIPSLGYGRGYTSNEILEDDRQQIEAIMRQLGYRRAKVSVKQGVSLQADDLIVTFVVEEGPLTRVSEVEIVGNKAFSTDELKKAMPQIEGREFSPARIRNGLQSLSSFYAERGYFDAKVAFRVVELETSDSNEEKVKVVYEIEKEGEPNVVGRISINGNERTKPSAIFRAITLKSGELLRATDIAQSEQNLYATDAFRRIEIKPEPAGETDDGKTQKDIVINVEEEKPRDLQYGGGFSTDTGPFGFVNLRYNNLFGRLQQASILARISRLQQLLQVDFLEPHFIREKNGFSPLRLTLQYQRDATVTRFFRSAFDRGTFGIVQRLDPNGNPIDVFGNVVENPAINRLTFSLDTQKTVSQKNRSVTFFRYRYEKVDLLNIDSLLIRDLLDPDKSVRISGFGSTFVFDTRKNCSRKQSLLEFIQKGELTNPCRYNPTDPTDGHYLIANYDISLPFLGANTGFQKFQLSYQNYYTLESLNTTVAGRVILGAGSVFSERSNRFPPSLSALSGILPISERFFAGGSTTLRGFEFESAGPRIVTVPTGIFRTSNGTPVFLSPFTTPLGGNAIAIANFELRTNLTRTIQAVPFYDGGNVFNRFKDIFNPPSVNPSDVLRSNLRAIWTHTFGLGFRIKTPIGGSVAIDFGYLLNPPRFLIPQVSGGNAIYQLRQTQVHFRFSQAF